MEGRGPKRETKRTKRIKTKKQCRTQRSQGKRQGPEKRILYGLEIYRERQNTNTKRKENREEHGSMDIVWGV